MRARRGLGGCLAFCLWWAGPVVGRAADGPVPGAATALVNRERVQQAAATNSLRYKGVDDVLVRPGLVADRRRQRLEILAESTGLSENSIVEFLLISETSCHGYEALAVAFAKPSDIHQALEFIGLPAGAPCNPQKLRMWPKGERVILSLVSPPGSTSTPVRIERLIMDKRADKPLPEVGFVFTGSVMVPHEGGGPGQEYGADMWEPKAIVSIYNEPHSVLSVPRIARQSDVYGSQVVNPEFALAKGTLLTLFLEPEYKSGRKRVSDLTLEVRPAADAARQTAADTGTGLAGSKAPPEGLPGREPPPSAAMAFELRDLPGQVLAHERSLPAIRAALESLAAKGCDPCVSVRFGRELGLGAVQVICRELSKLDDGAAMRVEPPSPGELYYRAFLADERWLKRENRASQPWELRLAPKGDTLSGKLSQVESAGEGEDLVPKFKTTETEIPDSRALGRRLEADAGNRKREHQRPRLPVMLVFADPVLTYGQLVDFIQPVLSLNHVVYVYLQKESKGVLP